LPAISFGINARPPRRPRSRCVRSSGHASV
jgi:hypothetical protein